MRRLLHSVAGNLEPSGDPLAHLQQAVPARRRRRRQLVAGAVAALALAGVSLPLAVHAVPGIGADDRSTNTASSKTLPGAAGRQDGPDGDGGSGAGAGSRPPHAHGKAGHRDGKAGASADPGGAGTGPSPTETANVTSPTCGREQLGAGSASSGSPDAAGRVYGTFRVANVSDAPCTVQGGGTVSAIAQGGARSAAIQVVDHTSGDAATGLPDPTDAPDQLVLEPGQAYEVRFAWVPREGGGRSGCATDDGSPTEDPAPPGETTGASDAPQGSAPAAGDGGDGGAGSQAGGSDGTSESGVPASVRLSNTPEAGGPTAAETVLSEACAGTVYRTGALPATS
ncbi:DUF4232 domain-containing protein [Streptomyces sp. NPDC059740]|uniref:DUF4232 domain-containing protein n=1 Tax=Streptomyces sp. NPDC059740 TaxID=3346926 RepID=UPI00364CB822